MEIDFISRTNDMEAKLEKARALQHGREYVEMCGELGVEPQDQELYDQGMADILYSPEQKQKPKSRKETKLSGIL